MAMLRFRLRSFFPLLLLLAFKCDAFRLESFVHLRHLQQPLSPLRSPHNWLKPITPSSDVHTTPRTRNLPLLWLDNNKNRFPGGKKYSCSSLFKFCCRQLDFWIPRLRRFHRRVLSAAVALLVVFSLHFGTLAACASSGYRTGGSFKSTGSSRSRSPPIHRTHYSRPSSHSPLYSTQRPLIGISQAPWFTSYRGFRAPPGYYDARTGAIAATGFSVGDVVLIAGVGTLIAYGVAKSRRDFRGEDNAYAGPLGPGATVASVVVSVNIPDINDPRNILKRLKAIAERADTSRREGIQELIQESTLELLRNERIINSAIVDSKHYRNPEAAQKDFNARSVESRSKYDREVSRYEGVQRSPPPSNDQASFLKASLGVITINIAIDGDSTKLTSMRNRSDLIAALRRIASDAPVEDCLFAAEVLWSPAEPGDILTREELYFRYPSLITV